MLRRRTPQKYGFCLWANPEMVLCLQPGVAIPTGLLPQVHDEPRPKAKNRLGPSQQVYYAGVEASVGYRFTSRRAASQ